MARIELDAASKTGRARVRPKPERARVDWKSVAHYPTAWGRSSTSDPVPSLAEMGLEDSVLKDAMHMGLKGSDGWLRLGSVEVRLSGGETRWNQAWWAEHGNEVSDETEEQEQDTPNS